MSESAGAATLPGFDADTAVAPLGGNRFGAEMSERWWVGRGPNGGYVAAVVLRAILAATGEARPPRSLTVHYPRAPKAGPVELVVEIEREGSRASFVSARMEQGGEVQATALAVLSEDWAEGGFTELEMPDAGEPGEMHAIEASDRPGAPRMLQNYLVRPAPTIDYTVHFRAPLPPPGATPEDAYLATFRTGLVRDGFFEEDGELWSTDGTLLAQSRQLALLLDPA